jgi:hypothetical protein
MGYATSPVWVGDGNQPPPLGFYYPKVPGYRGVANLKLGKLHVRRFFASFLLVGLVASLIPGAANALDYKSKPAATWIPNGQVWAMAVTPSRIYLGGDFTSLTNPATGGRVSRQHVVAIDRSTGNPSSTWAPAVVDAGTPGADTPTVAALNVGSDGTVYIGGDLESIGGKARNFVGAVDQDGTVLNSWRPAIDNRVWDFARSGKSLYMVGQFTEVDGQSRAGAARVSTTDAALLSWNPDLTGRAQAVAISGNKVYLGGTLTAVGGRPQEYLASVDAATGADTGWAPPSQCAAAATTCRVRDLAVDSRRVYAGIGGEPGGRAAAWSTSSNSPTPIWKDEADGDVQAVAVYDGVVYFGGHFSKSFADADGTSFARNQFAAVNPANGDVLPYTLPTNGPAIPGVWSLQADATGLRVGGTVQLSNAPYKNFLTFAAPGKLVPGPGSPTRVRVKMKGCKKCKVRLTQKRGTNKLWNSGWKQANRGKATFFVPTKRTVGLTATVDAPWERKFRRTTEVVMRYKGKPVGSKVSARAAKRGKRASSCYAGTTSKSITFRVMVKKVTVGRKVYPRAWAKKTKSYRAPTRRAPRGVLTIKRPTRCD